VDKAIKTQVDTMGVAITDLMHSEDIDGSESSRILGSERMIGRKSKPLVRTHRKKAH
jgi:hypothetical protein